MAERAAQFLRGRLANRESIVDFFSLLYGAALLDSAAGIDVSVQHVAKQYDTRAETLIVLRPGSPMCE